MTKRGVNCLRYYSEWNAELGASFICIDIKGTVRFSLLELVFENHLVHRFSLDTQSGHPEESTSRRRLITVQRRSDKEFV